MLQPFGELTNRTPSPAQHDGSRFARKHSPWTAARHKKKTRSVQSSLLDPSYEHSERCGSPEPSLEPGILTEDFEAEPSLADGFSPATTSCSSISPHSSPPIDRDEDAELHPSKAYIMDQQATNTDLLGRFADAANGKCRSPVWFGSAAQQKGVAAGAEGAQHPSHHHHSSSAPSNILSDRFDAVGQQQLDTGSLPDVQQLHGASTSHLCQDALQEAAATAVAPAAAPGRRRGLIARRRSWANAEQRKAPAGVGSFGISCLASNICASQNTSRSILAEVAHGSSLQAAVAAASGPWGQQQQHCSIPSSFQLCGSAAWSGRSQQSHSDDDLDDFKIRRPAYDMSDLYQQDDNRSEHISMVGRHPSNDTADVNSIGWYERHVSEAAEEADLNTAQQLWHALQSSGLNPSRKFIISYLMCCHYGGGDPFEAEEVVREMCAMTDTEPDAVMVQLLATIDLTWQQLHCGI